MIVDSLPPGWAITKLEDLVSILDSMREPVNNSERQQRIEGKLDSELFPYYGATGEVGKIDGYLFDEELVALGEDGVPFLDAKKSKAYMLHGKTWVNNHAHVLKAIEGITTNSFILNFLNQFDYQGYVNGGTRLKLTQANMRQIPIPLPSLAEQQQIAAKLDELLAQVDTLKTRLNTLPKILKRFRESILADAVSGKLTEDWRETNSFDVNNEILEIKRVRDEEFNLIAEKQFQRTGQNSRKLDFSTINEDSPLREIPNEWKLIQLGEIISYLTDYHANGSYEVLKEHVELKESEDYACMIRATNFEKNNFSNLMIYITEEAYQFLEKSKLFGGEILIGKIGNAGSVYLMPNLNRPASLAMNLFAIRFSKKLVDSKYIFYFLKSHVGDRNIQKYVRGVATKSIDKKSLRSVYINLPSYKEQTEIVQRVEQLFTYADQIEQRVKDAQARVNHLTQAILAKAFRGELTAEWREQNPDLISSENSAAALLARIKAERQDLETNKVTNRRTLKKSGENMKPKAIVSIIEALKAAGQPLSSQDLLVQSGYPNDATTEQLEAFFLDIRGQLNAKAITRNRQGDQDFFALAE